MSTTIHSSSCHATSGCERSRHSTTSYHSYPLAMIVFFIVTIPFMPSIYVSFLCRLRHFPLVLLISLYPVNVKFSTTFFSLCVPNFSTVFLNINVLFASILLKTSLNGIKDASYKTTLDVSGFLLIVEEVVQLSLSYRRTDCSSAFFSLFVRKKNPVSLEFLIKVISL